jgi:hypothetical protein
MSGKVNGTVRFASAKESRKTRGSVRVLKRVKRVSNQFRDVLETVKGGSCRQKRVAVSEDLWMSKRSAESLKGLAMNGRKRCSREMKQVVMSVVQSRSGAGAGRLRFLKSAA